MLSPIQNLVVSSLSYSEQDDQLLFQVQDQGIGIDEEDQERILSGFIGWTKPAPAILAALDLGWLSLKTIPNY